MTNKETLSTKYQRQGRRVWLLMLFFGIVCTYAAARLDLSIRQIPQGITRLGWLATLMMPPDAEGHLLEFLWGLLETLSIALLGTFLASVVAIVLAFLAAQNVMPTRLLPLAMRRLLDAVRGVDVVIWALMFVSALGLGPFAGLMAIAVADVGILGRLFADIIEDTDPRLMDGLRATGATRLELARFAVLPQVLPLLISNSLYTLESNTRQATILGIVGGGGIGLLLSDRIRANEWPQVALLLILILVTVTLLDYGSGWLRRRLIGTQATQRVAID